MRSSAVAGACLVAATVICVIGSIADSPRVTSVICTVGAGTAFAGAASGYRATAGIRRRALPAGGMALLGIATSLWMVDSTLRIADAAGQNDRALTVLAVFAGGAGLALLAAAAWRVGQMPRPIGILLAALASFGAVLADPALLYLTGAAPLGIALIWAGTAVPTMRRERTMRSVYKVLAYVVAAEVIIQAMVMVYAIAGLSRWLMDGGVLDKAVVESGEVVFPEIRGYAIHVINGGMVVPLLALLLLVLSFFAKVPGGIKWAGTVLLLVIVQASLGAGGRSIPFLGALHGLNALLLFSAAFYTGRRVHRATAAPVVESPERVAAPV